MTQVKKIVLILFVFAFGVVAGYVSTIYTLFPTCDGNAIFATAPVVDVHSSRKPKVTAVAVHLSLIHDMSLLRKQSWCYQFSVSDSRGENVYAKEFDPETVGGLFNLNTSGNLKWDEDAKVVTACIDDFVYRYELSDI